MTYAKPFHFQRLPACYGLNKIFTIRTETPPLPILYDTSWFHFPSSHALIIFALLSFYLSCLFCACRLHSLCMLVVPQVFVSHDLCNAELFHVPSSHAFSCFFFASPFIINRSVTPFKVISACLHFTSSKQSHSELTKQGSWNKPVIALKNKKY